MADIDIQEKKGSVWPWVIGLLALVLVVWVGMEMLGDDDEEFAATIPGMEQPADPALQPTAGTAPAEVQRFEQECALQGQTGERMSRGHEHTQTCIRHMTEALDAVVERETVNDAPLQQQLEQYRTRASQLTEDPASQEHSVQLAQIFNDAAGLIERIEESRESTGQALAGSAERVREAADAFSPERTVLDQQEEVTAFFREVSNALRALADGQGVQE